MLAETHALPTHAAAVVIGASAGGIDVLRTLLPSVPKTTTVPIVVAVHIPGRVPSLLTEVFSRTCAVSVREPFDKEPVTPAIWFAPANYHLLFSNDRTFSLSVDAPVNFSRPSIDVLFESAADVFGPDLIAIVLSGGNEDGALGSRAVKSRGGTVIVQTPSDAEVSRMPVAAIDASHPQHILDRNAIGLVLAQLRNVSQL